MSSGREAPPSRPLVLLSQRLGPITELERRLESAGAEVRGAPLWTLDDIREHAAGARIIILGAVEPFDEATLSSLPQLIAVVRRGVGTDNVDLAAATSLGILVANVPDASVEEVSDHALTLLLAIERQVLPLDGGIRAGTWTQDPSAIIALRQPIRRLARLTLGIVGLGRIGRALARKAAPIYGRIIGSDPLISSKDAASFGVTLVSLDELLGAADHVSLHAPLTPETRHLLDDRSLGRIRPGAVVVNTSRGGLVDEAALIRAVGDGRVRSAALDVTATEPLPPDSPLIGEPRILLTGHSAASSASADEELARRSVDAAAAILRGRRPESVANPDVLERTNLRTGQLVG